MTAMVKEMAFSNALGPVGSIRCSVWSSGHGSIWGQDTIVDALHPTEEQALAADLYSDIQSKMGQKNLILNPEISEVLLFFVRQGLNIGGIKNYQTNLPYFFQYLWVCASLNLVFFKRELRNKLGLSRGFRILCFLKCMDITLKKWTKHKIIEFRWW